MKNIIILALIVQGVAAYSQANPVCAELFDASRSIETRAKASDKADLVTIRSQAVASGPAVKAYFEALGKSIFERSNVLKVMLNAIVAKEHVLLVGAPGNAKTTLTKLVFENIIDPNNKNQPSFFATQMTAETSLSDTHGGINYEVLNRTGRQERLYEEGILGARFAMLDEQFDMRPNGYRNILDVLAERAHAQGGKKHKGLTWTVVGASNTFIPEVYQRFDGSEQPRALIDRYSFVLLVPAELEKVASRRAVVKGSTQGQKQLPHVTLNDFEALQNLVPQVEIPDYIADILTLIQYRMKTVVEAREQTSLQEFKDKVLAGEKPIPPYKSTKYMSDRTMGKAARVLAAQVAIDFALNGGKRKLVANMSDLNILVDFYSLGGPEAEAEIQHQISRAAKEIERDQLKTILWERKTAKEIISSVVGEINKKLTELGAQELYQKVRLYSTMSAPERRELIDTLRAFYVRGLEISTMDQKQIDQNPGLIAEVSMADVAVKWLDFLNLPNKNEVLASWSKNAPISKKRNLDNRYLKASDDSKSSFNEFNGKVRLTAENEKKTNSKDTQSKGKASHKTTSTAEAKFDSSNGNESDSKPKPKPNSKPKPTKDAKTDTQLLEVTDSNTVAGSAPIRKSIDPMLIYELRHEFKKYWMSTFPKSLFKDFLDRGLDPNAFYSENFDTNERWTLVGIMSYHGRADLVQLALDYGADPNKISSSVGNGSRSALEWAKFAGNETVAVIIQNHIAQVGVSNDSLRP